MTLTVLALQQEVSRSIGFAVPSAYNTNLQLLNLTYQVARELRDERNFPQQKRRHSFTVTSGRSRYPLPQDFYAGIFDTPFDTTNDRHLLGPLSDGEFTWVTYGATSISDTAYRVFGFDSNPNTGEGQFEIFPTPSNSTDILYFEYICANLFLPPNWAPSTAYTSGQYVNVSNNIYLCDTNGTSSTTPPSTQVANITDGTTRWDYYASAYETVLTDNDLLLFDDRVMQAGLSYYYRKAKGFEYEEDKLEFDRMKREATTRFHGSYMGTFGSGGRSLRDRYTVPYRGWSL